jgi:hypothetical protein
MTDSSQMPRHLISDFEITAKGYDPSAVPRTKGTALRVDSAALKPPVELVLTGTERLRSIAHRRDLPRCSRAQPAPSVSCQNYIVECLSS